MKKVTLASLLVVVLASLVAFPAFAAGGAMVRVIHASPDAPAVDIYVNGQPAFTNLEFPKATNYAEVPAGSYEVKVFPAAAKGSGNPVINVPALKLDAKNYTVIATGKVANIAPIVLEDNLAKPAAGKAHVRFVHASPDAPAVDITLADGTKIFPNVAFGKYSDFTPVAAGTYNLQARLAGATTVALDLPGVKLEDGMIYTVIATGLVNGTPKLAAQIVTYPAQAAGAPATMPTTGGALAFPSLWLVVAAGLALLGLGTALRFQTKRQ